MKVRKDGTLEVQPVDDNGGSLTIDNSDLTSLGGTVSGSELQVDVVAALPAGTNNIGEVDAVGDVAHDTADSGDPVKVGGVAEDYDTVPEGSDPGPTEVADGDRCQLSLDQAGRIIERPISSYHTLDNVSTTYNNTTTTATSQNIDCEKYRRATLCYSITESGAATDIRFEIFVSLDGTNYMLLTNNALASLLYDDATISNAGTLSEAYTFEIACQNIRVRVDTNGTGASDTFTVTNATLYLRN